MTVTLPLLERFETFSDPHPPVWALLSPRWGEGVNFNLFWS